MSLQKIIFDCERMKYPHTGLYHFCHQLGMALKEQADPAKEEISFYVRESEHSAFGNHANYLKQNSLHKFILPPIGKYSVWHATYQATQYYPFNRRIKTVFTIHDLNFLYDDSKPAFKRERELKKIQKRIDRADHVVGISAFTLNDVKNNLKLGNKPSSVIYNGCNFRDIGVPQPPAQSPPGKFLYTIGTITDKKNFHVLPALLAGNEMQLIVSGIVQSEAYFQKIKDEAVKHGVADRVIFTGAVSENDKQWYMSHCEAFLFPSLAEGFGLPVIEAMRVGVPVILSTLTALPEIGGTQAYYFQQFDPEYMRQVLSGALNDFASDRAGKSAAIKERAAYFNWKDAANQYLQIYRSLYEC